MTARPARTAIARLVSAAGGDRDHLDDTLAAIGAEAASGIATAELIARSDLPQTIDGITVLVRLRHRETVFEHRLYGLPPGRHADVPDAVVEQDLGEMVQALFGPRGPRPAATRTIRWRDLQDRSSFGRTLPVVDVVRRLLDPADRPYAPGLAELCVRYGSDKWGEHQYPRQYERYFEPLRDRVLTVLEIGVGGFSDPCRGGASLRAWRHYFPRALVHGIDIVDKSALSGPRMTILAGDQSDRADLARLLDVSGPPDIVIDDGSHVSAHLLASFEVLFPALRPGGLYVLEDLQTSYWPSFGGRDGESDDPGTSMGFLKKLVDGLNHEEIDGRHSRPTDALVGGVHFHHNLAVVEKAVNLEGGAPAWIPRR